MTYQICLYLLSLLRAVIFELLKSAQQHAKHSLISEGTKIKAIKTIFILTLGREWHSKSSVTSHTTQWHHSGNEQRVHGLMQNQQTKC